MTYREFIDNILYTRGRRSCGEGYCETHHIMPRCMGGTDEEENLIDLYAREHFIAHKLLAKENPDNNSLFYAYWMMCNCRDVCTPDEYEEARIKCSGMSKSEITRQRMSENHADVSGENNPNYGKDFNGVNNPHYGHKHNDKTKSIMSELKQGLYDGSKNPRARAVYCIELDEVFGCAKDAERKYKSYKINGTSVIACCRGRQKTAGEHPITREKLHWVYVEK